ncbi:hypothetical protein PPYC1_16390 [Paenibacillus polymyxa]|nr:hypothetical protein ABE82_08105 [Paenibacillus peoriae]APB71845.1 hypothetical protein PPYC1_16390 [Paenibacillus polymyxa]
MKYDTYLKLWEEQNSLMRLLERRGMNQKFFIMALIRGFLIGDTFFLIGALALYFTRRYELIKCFLDCQH